MQDKFQGMCEIKRATSIGRFSFPIAISIFFLFFLSSCSSTDTGSSPPTYKVISDTTTLKFNRFNRQVVSFVNKIKQYVEFLASHEIVRSVPPETNTYLTERRMMDPSNGHPNEAQIFQFYEKFSSENKEVLYVYLGTNSGGFIQFPPETIGNYDPRKGHWYKMGVANPDIVGMTDVYRGVTGEPTISVMKEIGGNGVPPVGVQSLDISLSSLVESFNAIDPGGKSHLILLDGNGYVLSDSDAKHHKFKRIQSIKVPFYQKLAEHLPSKNSTNFEININANSSIFVFAHHINALDWHLIRAVDSKELKTQKLQ